MHRLIPLPSTALIPLSFDRDCAEPARPDGLWAVSLGPEDDQAAPPVGRGTRPDERAQHREALAEGTREWGSHTCRHRGGPPCGASTRAGGPPVERAQGTEMSRPVGPPVRGERQGRPAWTLRAGMVWRGDSEAEPFLHSNDRSLDDATATRETPARRLTARRVTDDSGI